MKAYIKTPSIKCLENNKSLENSLNEKYLTENKKLYEAFMADMEELKKDGGGHIGIKSGYVVKTDTDYILAIERYAGSSVNTYEVAPGVMGSPEFIIPTDVISNVIVGNEYIK